jgi:hypothetical protein
VGNPMQDLRHEILRLPSCLDIDSNNHLWIIGTHGTGSDKSHSIKHAVIFRVLGITETCIIKDKNENRILCLKAEAKNTFQNIKKIKIKINRYI